MITFKCSGCGVKVTAADDAAGKRGKCKTCGAVNTIPSRSTTSSISITTATKKRQADTTDYLAGSQPREPVHPAVKFMLIGGGVLIAGILVYFWLFRDTWEIDNSSRIQELAREAVVLRANGQLQDAITKSQLLLDLVGGRTLRDEKLAYVIANAKRDMANAIIELEKQAVMQEDALAKRKAEDEARRKAVDLARLQAEQQELVQGEVKTVAFSSNDAEADSSYTSSRTVADDKTKDDITESSDLGLKVGLGVALASIFVVGYWIFCTRCPNCKRYFSKQELASQVVAEEDGYKKKVVREKITKGDGFWEPQVELGTVERQVVVPVRRQQIVTCYKCKHCGHTWATSRIRETELG